MRHKKIQKWLSDRNDGELSEKRKKILEMHLERCVSCRSYGEDLERISEETEKVKLPEVSSSYWEDFTHRLKAKISPISAEERRGKEPLLRWRWAFAAAVSIFVVALGLLLYNTQDITFEEVYLSSFKGSLSKIYQQLGSDKELEEAFNSILLASLAEDLETDRMNAYLDFYEDKHFWENFSQEEIDFLEAVIRKETKL
jgi:hypothetical protein